MPPQKSKGGSRMLVDSDLQLKKKLQAVVITDSFDKQLQPVTNELPRVLFPVANIVLLDLTIEFLAATGVQEIIILATFHPNKILDYCSRYAQSIAYRNIKVRVIPCKNSNAPCDSLRELERENCIESDFLLVNGPLVSNLKLSFALKEHLARREKNKKCMMTMVLKQRNTKSQRTNENICAFGLDSSGQILSRQPMPSSKSLSFSTDMLKKRGNIELRLDLMDCSIDICSPELLPVIADNFDWMDLREDVLNGFLKSEIMGYKIHSHIIDNEYVGSVTTFNEYRWVQQDILRRWSYPLVLDANLGVKGQEYRYSRGNVYRERNVRLSRDCELKINTAVGQGTSIGARSIIANSAIGRDVTIGSNCVIEGSSLWDGAVIEDDVKIIDSVVCADARIKPGANISRCVLSFGTIIGRNVQLSNRRVRCGICATVAQEIDSGKKQPTFPDRDVGYDGVGSFCVCAESELLEDDDEFDDDDDEFDEESSMLMSKPASQSGVGGVGSFSDDPESQRRGSTSQNDTFVEEVVSTITRDFKANASQETMSVEVKSLRMTSNRDNFSALQGIVKGLFGCVEGETNAQIFTSARNVVISHKNLISQFVESERDEVPMIYLIEEVIVKNPSELFKNAFQVILKTMYEVDLLSEDSLNTWKENPTHRSLSEEFIARSPQLIEWLEMEESSDEDGSSDDDADDED